MCASGLEFGDREKEWPLPLEDVSIFRRVLYPWFVRTYQSPHLEWQGSHGQLKQEKLKLVLVSWWLRPSHALHGCRGLTLHRTLTEGDPFV